MFENNMVSIERNIGIRIKLLRQSKNETQQQLGEMVGVVQQSVAAWESGRCMPSIISLMRLASHYNVSTDSVLGVSADTYFACSLTNNV